jgi:RNA polymerase sigma factor (sigma-70 family)
MLVNADDAKDFGQLMSELAHGSEEAAWTIAHAYTPHVLRAVRKVLPNSIRSKVDSQDLAQMIWASLLFKGMELQELKSPQQLMNLLVSIARNKSVDAYRHYTASQKRDHRRESSLNSSHATSNQRSDRRLRDSEPTPSRLVRFRDEWEHVMRSLSSQDLEILKCRMNGKTYAEISAEIGVGITKVRTTLEQIVRQLRDE